MALTYYLDNSSFLSLVSKGKRCSHELWQASVESHFCECAVAPLVGIFIMLNVPPIDDHRLQHTCAHGLASDSFASRF